MAVNQKCFINTAVFWQEWEIPVLCIYIYIIYYIYICICIYILNTDLIITVPAVALPPNGTGTSVSIVLTIKLHIFSSKVLWLSMILIEFPGPEGIIQDKIKENSLNFPHFECSDKHKPKYLHFQEYTVFIVKFVCKLGHWKKKLSI